MGNSHGVPVSLTANGDAQHSTAQYKTGSSSMLFDGSGDYLQLPSDAGFSFGTGDFTVECWVYYPPIANTNGKMIIDSRPTSSNGSYWHLGSSPAGNIAFTTIKNEKH